jgi:hypothetical protein
MILFAFLFCLTKKETPRSSSEAKKVKALNFYFVRNTLFYNDLKLVANNFNYFLKLRFFKNVLAEILKINSFNSVAKTIKFKAEYFRLAEANTH